MRLFRKLVKKKDFYPWSYIRYLCEALQDEPVVKKKDFYPWSYIRYLGEALQDEPDAVESMIFLHRKYNLQ